MSPEAFAHVSNLVIPTATVIYALAMMSHALEWAMGRGVTATAAAEQPAEVLVASSAAGTQDVAVPAAGGATAAAGSFTGEGGSARAEAASRIGLMLTWLAFVLHLTGVVTRGLAAGRVPWGNMYEFSITASLAVAAVYLLFVHRYKLQWLGLGVTLVVAAVLGLATLALYTPAGPLVPALHSYWLVIHVSAAAISGGAFTIGALVSILYLVKSRAERRVLAGGTMSASLKRLPSAEAMDGTAYKVLAFAFPLWTFGVLVAGPIWAEYAWGRYWGWDPKEVWSLVTWVVYAAYLHARATAGWRGRRAATIAIVGWFVFIFNFVGVNLLVSGLHSYAGV
ncbi:cytochrome c-type biogenesis protein CcsB [Kribbella orskensis]|uniref:Cytochrome c-type biogenesis protein CcsB n=1 Tax=Kribbella orskensis TaxID=2512216 RepID=A0ABY2BKN9_9ACTN|nr:MULTISPECIES: c-type cytochrome biogenesis protein CcsB [Kribbella]TCN40408.1 cytochrome c-type biogenesis protein CcsB [Kribbella sp. VKM Ac-2500]TCO23028.1 cytochrome c-type biogenesis protein CcsB [Kribbella orskensis]